MIDSDDRHVLRSDETGRADRAYCDPHPLGELRALSDQMSSGHGLRAAILLSVTLAAGVLLPAA